MSTMFVKAGNREVKNPGARGGKTYTTTAGKVRYGQRPVPDGTLPGGLSPSVFSRSRSVGAAPGSGGGDPAPAPSNGRVTYDPQARAFSAPAGHQWSPEDHDFAAGRHQALSAQHEVSTRSIEQEAGAKLGVGPVRDLPPGTGSHRVSNSEVGRALGPEAAARHSAHKRAAFRHGNAAGDHRAAALRARSAAAVDEEHGPAFHQALHHLKEAHRILGEHRARAGGGRNSGDLAHFHDQVGKVLRSDRSDGGETGLEPYVQQHHAATKPKYSHSGQPGTEPFPHSVQHEGSEYSHTGRVGHNVKSGAEVAEYSHHGPQGEGRVWVHAHGKIERD